MAQWPMLQNKKQYPWAEGVSQLSPFNKERQVLLKRNKEKTKKGKPERSPGVLDSICPFKHPRDLKRSEFFCASSISSRDSHY